MTASFREYRLAKQLVEDYVVQTLTVAILFLNVFIPTVFAQEPIEHLQTVEQNELGASPGCIEIIKGTERHCEKLTPLRSAQTAPQWTRESKCELTHEDYAVFGALLSDFHRPEILIANVTATHKSEGQTNWAAPSQETFGDYVKKAPSACAVKPKFGDSHSYKIIEVDNLFKKGLEGGWQEFYKKYSECAGFWQFSRPGYNSSRDEALLYVVHGCGVLCGDGFLYLLSKQSGKWTVKDSVRLWIS